MLKLKNLDKENDKPSSSTVLYWLIQDKQIEPEVFFNFLEVFWPDFCFVA